MKKTVKKIMSFLVVVAMLFVVGCGNSEKAIDGSVQNLNAGESRSGANTGSADTQAVSKEDVVDETAGSEKGYVFYFNGTTVMVDAEAGPVIEKLGEPVSYFEAASCAFEGLDKMYTYSGFEVDTYPMEDIDYISAVILKDDTVLTVEGIGIGDSMEKLKEAYPGNSAEENGMIVYEKDGMKLCFIVQEDIIISIEYRSMALDVQE